MKRLVLALSALAGSLVVAELGLRLADYAGPEPTGNVGVRWVPESPYLPHPVYGHRTQPGWSGALVYELEDGQPALEVPVAFGDDEMLVHREPDDGDRRLVVLGDSIAFGQGVPSTESFPSLLSERVDGWHVEIAARPAWGLDQEVAWVEVEGERVAPDAVLVVTYFNDHTSSPMRGRERGVIRVSGSETREAIAHPLHLVNVLERRRQAEALADLMYGEGHGPVDALSQRVDEMGRHYERLAEVCPSRCAVAVAPAMIHDTPEMRQALEAVAAVAREAGLPAFSAVDALDEVHAADRWVHPVDPHPSARSHAAIADALEAPLRSWLAEDSGDE